MLNLMGFPDLVQRFTSQARASTTATLNFTTGSILRVLAEAQAGVGLWFQWLILDVLRQTRLATSVGGEVDTWVQDFGIARLPASASRGMLVLSRATPGFPAFIPLGATVRTADSTQTFAVVTDTANPAWNGLGYAIAPSTPFVAVPAAAIVGGVGGNVLAGTVTVLTTAIAGIDTVTNPAPFTGGLDAETDAALRTRFKLFVDSRARGTKHAALYAVASMQQGLDAVVVESGGGYTVVVDDGSGAPPSSLLQQVYAACDAVRPLGSNLYVIAPTLIVASVTLTITAKAGYAKTNLIAAVANALLAYIDGLGIGEALGYAHIAQVVLNVPGVANAHVIRLNGSTADLGGGATQIVRANLGTIAIT